MGRNRRRSLDEAVRKTGGEEREEERPTGGVAAAGVQVESSSLGHDE